MLINIPRFFKHFASNMKTMIYKYGLFYMPRTVHADLVSENSCDKKRMSPMFTSRKELGLCR